MAFTLRITIPPLTRLLLFLLLALSLVTHFITHYRLPPARLQLVPWITVVPVTSLRYPWVFLTAPWVEQNILTLLIAAATLLYGGRYVERAWGSQEFGLFIVVVTVVPNVVAAILYVLAFAVTRSDSLVSVSLQGSIAIQAAFLVAFKQLVPEHTVTILRGLVKIRVKHFPAIFLVANTVSAIVFVTDTAAVLSWLGFLTGWTYLRFYKRQPDMLGTGTTTGPTIVRGDASETFAFAYFWPDAVQGPMVAVSDAVFNALVALRVCTPFSADEIESSNEQAQARGERGLPTLMDGGGRRGAGGRREEAERRRALALKALDERLHAASANRQQPVPSTVPSKNGSGPAIVAGETMDTQRDTSEP